MRKRITLIAAVLMFAGLSLAQEAHSCSNATLHGSFGFVITGTRPVPPPSLPGIESVVGTAITTFDGEGNFAQTDNVHGATSGYTPERPGSGTYSVNPDCTGTMILNNESVPFGLVLSIVVVDNGKEIRAAVVKTTATACTTTTNITTCSPPPIMVTSNGRRM